MSNTAITVIIPAYQIKDYLSSCLDSLLNQDFELTYRIMLIEHGSTDGTADVCREYQEKYPDKIFYYHYPENHGVSVGRNIGILHAIGKYITFVDGDDIVNTNYLSSLYETAESNHAQAVFGGYDIQRGKKIIAGKAMGFSGNGKDALLRYFNSTFKDFRPYVWGSLYSREFLLASHLNFDQRFSYFEDWDFMYRLLMAADKVVFMPKTIYLYQERVNSAMHIVKDLVTPHLAVLQKDKEYTYQHDIDIFRKLFREPKHSLKKLIKEECVKSGKEPKEYLGRLADVFNGRGE